MKAEHLLVLLLTAVPIQASGQEAVARQATPEETGRAQDEEICPMALEVPLKRVNWSGSKKVDTTSTRSTARFVCDKARVAMVMFTTTSKRKSIELAAEAHLKTDWYRQDIDLRMSITWSDGGVLASKDWRALTIGTGVGPFAGTPKSPQLVIDLGEDQLARLRGGETPTLKITLSVPDSEGAKVAEPR
jgi:hypothetical protein